MKKNILLSIGPLKNKKQLIQSIKKIPSSEFNLFATNKTSKFLDKNGVDNKRVFKIYESKYKPNLADYLIKKDFAFIINIPTHKKHSIDDSEYTDGYYIRKKAVQKNIPLITDVEVAKLYIDSLTKNFISNKLKSSVSSPETNPFTPFYQPLYDINKSYDFNYEFGPFFSGVFPEVSKKRQYSFLGFKLQSLFGVPAGPLLNSNWVETYAKLGFDILTYKTVRTINKACHQPPNVVFIDPNKKFDYDLKNPAYAKKNQVMPYKQISITNSFGVPSKEPDVWKEDVERLLPKLDAGQLLILSVMGTAAAAMTEKEFVDDFVKCATYGKETGVKAIEINLSCPNLGSGSICKDLASSQKIITSVKKAIGNIALLVKLSYFDNPKELENFVTKTQKHVDCYVAINTVPKQVFQFNGIQALPGKSRLISGTCGSLIKQAGLKTVRELSKIKKKHKLKYEIMGVGGVMTPDDYFDYLQAGANAVQSATGAMWNPYLAYQIRLATKKSK